MWHILWGQRPDSLSEDLRLGQVYKFFNRYSRLREVHDQVPPTQPTHHTRWWVGWHTHCTYPAHTHNDGSGSIVGADALYKVSP